MTLHVPLDDFASTVKRLFDHSEAYIAPHGAGTVATASSKGQEVIVAAISKELVEAVQKSLTAAGMTIHRGTWSQGNDLPESEISVSQAHIAAVAYQSSENKPGIWVDAFPSLPTQVQALKAMFDEFRSTGELADVSFEEFVRHANPNVVILNPAEIHSFLAQKNDC